MLAEAIKRVEDGLDLPVDLAEAVARALADPAVAETDKKQFLIALHAKGESVAEVTAFARVFRSLAIDPGLEAWRDQAIDIVGTGGSGSGGYNVSSVAAIIVASAGVPVLKHGNRAITSQSGSADFLGALGLPLQTEPSRLRESLERLCFCFFFAPAFHPAFKNIAPVRKELAAEGKRSVFNILGPLINPAKPQRQLLGVFAAEWVNPLAESLTALGLARGLVVHSALTDGRRVDELTTGGSNIVRGVGRDQAIDARWTPTDLGFDACLPADLTGGSPAANVETFLAMLDGGGPRGLVDTVCVNAGAALYLADRAPDVRAGASFARDHLLGGAVQAWLERARALYRTFTVS